MVVEKMLARVATRMRGQIARRLCLEPRQLWKKKAEALAKQTSESGMFLSDVESEIGQNSVKYLAGRVRQDLQSIPSLAMKMNGPMARIYMDRSELEQATLSGQSMRYHGPSPALGDILAQLNMDVDELHQRLAAVAQRAADALRDADAARISVNAGNAAAIAEDEAR